ncbi:glycosyltransferase [Microlunatus panaciterrae]|uniref:GT2 family glycosyltransferase n=1 Tax=Microlunatus panaciterrae TaxID=400768 RepID=A0ABS2RL92_9ACTN|nr:glycosyltransferase family 2 protein [Microlunatus panaciterrae]MBM7799775.1 GT2 family glycosyltransferase [Microlunatus panaciterrae]
MAEQATVGKDLWAWAEFDDDETDVDISGCVVTAVLVTHDAAPWLPDTLAGIAALSHRPNRLVAIDNESTDQTRQLLDGAARVGLIDAVYTGSRTHGFGAAVQDALRQDRGHTRSAGQPADEWLWLLHDDAVPAPDTLDALLTHVCRDSSIDVTGPKLLLPKRRQLPQQISEVGISISGTGRRELYLEQGEIDQGQRDKPADRLAVSTCGMLVRFPVWQRLAGFDPMLPVFRDGVEFGWRAHLAGFRVMTTPAAEMVHRQVGRAGLRPDSAAGSRPGRTDRLLGMLVVAGHAPLAALPVVWLRLVWSCLVHAVGYLVGKVPGRALDELLALGSFLAHPGRIHELRAKVGSIEAPPGARDRVDALRPPWWSSLRVAVETVSAAVADRYHSVAGDSDSASLDELTGDDFSAVAEERRSSPWFSPVVIATGLAVVASLFAARRLFGSGSLTSPVLLPARSTAADAWSAFLAPIVGAPQLSSPPWLGLVAVGATLTAGHPEWLVTLLLCGIVPLSLLSAYPVVRRAVADGRVRLWVAATYALLPALLGGTNQGRLAMSIVAVSLPLLVLAGRALVLRRPRNPEAWRGGWGAGLVLVVLVAFEPSMMIMALLLGAIGAVTMLRTPRKVGRIGIALAVPLVVLAPWWPSLAAHWGRALAGPDSALDGAPAAPSPWALLLGRDLGSGLPPLWLTVTVFGVVWLVALVGLARRPRSRAVVAGWTVALVALMMAVLISRVVVTLPPVGTELRPWPGTYLLIAFGALLVAGGAGVDGLTDDLGSRSFSFVQPAVVMAGAAIALVSLVAAGWWIWAGLAGPVTRTSLTAIPPYVLNAQQSDLRVRTLAIDLTQDIGRYQVVADDQVRLGDADRGFTFGASTTARSQTEDVVIRLLAGTGDEEIAPELVNLGIGYIWVTGATPEERSLINNTPGLGTASGNRRGVVWQLEQPVGRVMLVDGDREIPVAGPAITVGASNQARELRISEPKDPRWSASFNGRPLRAVDPGSWQQVFEVPAAAGRVEFSLRSSGPGWVLVQGLLLVVVAVLAAPAVRRPEVRDPARSARRAATVIGAQPR